MVVGIKAARGNFVLVEGFGVIEGDACEGSGEGEEQRYDNLGELHFEYCFGVMKFKKNASSGTLESVYNL